MIFIGIDDTDIVDSPGTNQLALQLAARLSDAYYVERIVRHQLLDDPRVPYTSQNGSASLVLRPHDSAPTAKAAVAANADRLAKWTRNGNQARVAGATPQEFWGVAPATHPQTSADLLRLFDELRPAVAAWSPPGSDPGLCVAATVPAAVIEFGRRCQRELVPQRDARELAARAGLLLSGLGGTEDGVIGALAAVGLAAGANDGRVIYLGAGEPDLSAVSSWHPLAELVRFGVESVCRHDTGEPVVGGSVDVGKKLRPNFRNGQTVLYVVPAENGAGDADRREEPRWQAVKVL